MSSDWSRETPRATQFKNSLRWFSPSLLDWTSDYSLPLLLKSQDYIRTVSEIRCGSQYWTLLSKLNNYFDHGTTTTTITDTLFTYIWWIYFQYEVVGLFYFGLGYILRYSMDSRYTWIASLRSLLYGLPCRVIGAKYYWPLRRNSNAKYWNTTTNETPLPSTQSYTWIQSQQLRRKTKGLQKAKA